MRTARHGLTLVEILVATALVVFMLGAATAGFLQMRTLARRVEALQQLHNSARTVHERLAWEIACLMPGAACFVSSTAPGAGTPGTVELVFMRGKLDDVDFTLDSQFGASADTLTDQLWTRWSYSTADGQLMLAASRPARWWSMSANWVSGGYNFYDKKFRNLPTLQRAAAGSAQATLDANAYGSPDVSDIGDYADLDENTSAIAANCTAFAVEIVCHDGSVRRCSEATTATWAADGQFVDGRGGPTIAARPRLIRTRFTLVDPATGVAESFSFSFLPPALSPR